MLDEALRDDPRHDLVGVVDPLAAAEAQGEDERVDKVVGRDGFEVISGPVHGGRIDPRREQKKNTDSMQLALSCAVAPEVTAIPSATGTASRRCRPISMP